MKKVFLILLFVGQVLLGQNTNELFTNANNLYKNGKYEEAIELYKKIENNGLISSELYYNLGNCYYKLNKVAPTIYNYEKALQIDPTNDDAKNNLIFAKRLTLDRIEELPKSLSQKIETAIFSKISYNTWGIIAILFSSLATLLFLAYYFSDKSSLKKLYFTLSVVCVLFLLSSFGIAKHQYNKEKNTTEAIIFTEEIIVFNEPTQSADEAFKLHEGTKVLVLDAVDEWKKIKLADGKLGWIIAKNIKEL